MKATIDREGRIALAPELQSELGVQPGDDVLLENRGGDWIIKAAKTETGLCYEGELLVHRGTALPVAADEAELLEDIGRIHAAPRNSQKVPAKVVSIPRRAISIATED
jgi:bifunctional DNA-binding transcriptional regulator/antitoxin component of YhaV-PrlF toxin-antitoxin module